MKTVHQHHDGFASPPAVRLRRPGWRDPRLLLGVVLVAASVALGSWAVGAAGSTQPVYVAVQPLVAGEAVDADAVRVQQVRLDAALVGYLAADEPLPEDLVAVRTVEAGELVPMSALADGKDLGLRPVAVTPTGALPSGVVEGSAVDLWFVPAPAGGAPSDAAATAPVPRELAAGLTVAEVSEGDGAFALGAPVTVHVLVPVAELAEVLAALADEGAVEVVPVPGGTP